MNAAFIGGHLPAEVHDVGVKDGGETALRI